jgi:SAM-dependent methyltransferase
MFLKKITTYVTNLFSRSTYCSVCDAENYGFNKLPDYYISQYKKFGFKYFNSSEMTPIDTYSCRKCGASDRERLYAHWISIAFSNGTLSRNMKAIHFAPENSLSNFIKINKFFDIYQTADLLMDHVDFKVDLTNLKFKDNSYDFFICSHILEHILDDNKAIFELKRILKPNGYGILIVPIIIDLKSTIELSNITSDEDRWKYYGQNDHVRLYSHNDFINKILKTGLKIEQYKIDFFGENLFNKLGLKKTSVLYIVNKKL